jgi:hypothetical protein
VSGTILYCAGGRNDRPGRDHGARNFREFLSATAICNLARSHTRRESGNVSPWRAQKTNHHSLRVICLADRSDPGALRRPLYRSPKHIICKFPQELCCCQDRYIGL